MTTGAYDDLQKAKNLAYALVTKYGMSEKIGYMGFEDEARQRYSNETATIIDEEVREIIMECSRRT